TLGRVIADTFSLRGLFGIDFILRDSVAWPVEVNPRYTASVEVVERATGIHALGSHAAVFEPSFASPKVLNCSEGIRGKAILFAEKELTFPQAGPWSTSLLAKWNLRYGPDFADIPAPGTRVKVGQPVLTVFARATSINECEQRLRESAAVVYRALNQCA